MSFRIVKQILYGIFYLIVLAGICWLVYLWFLQPPPTCFDNKQNQGEQGVDCGGPCAKLCVGSNIQPIEISERPIIFHSTEKGISVFAEIQNPNAQYAAEKLPYTFTVYGQAGAMLGKVNGESYIYGGEIKYLSMINYGFPTVQSVELSIGDPEWVPASAFKKPDLSLQNLEKISESWGNQVKGQFTNNDTVILPEVTAFAIFFDAGGNPAGISKNEFVDVPPGKVQDFSIIYPAFPDADPSQTRVFVYGKRPVLPASNQ